MGIEQILLPIIGGMAKGVGAGLEEKRRERSEAQARAQRELFDSVKNNWEAMQTPQMQTFLKGYLGKEYFPVFLAAKRAEMAAENRQKEDYLQGILYRQDQGQPTADMTGVPSNPTGLEARGGTLLSSNQGDFGGAPTQASNPLMALISQFMPQQVRNQLMPPEPSTGPPSGPQVFVQRPPVGPQGYPAGGGPMAMPQVGSDQPSVQAAQQNALQAQGGPGGREGGAFGGQPQITPQVTTQPTAPQGAMQSSVIIGKLPSGKPVVRQADGSFASHNLTVVGDDRQLYVIPTLIGGKQLSEMDAVSVFQKSNGVDPDTGQVIQVFTNEADAIKARDQAVAQQATDIAQVVGHLKPELQNPQPRQPVQPTRDPRTRPAGVTQEQWERGEVPLTATSKAFGGEKNREGVVTVKDLPSGVTYSTTVGKTRFTFKRPEPAKQEEAMRLAAKDLGLPEDPQERTAEQDRAVFVRSLDFLGEKAFRTSMMTAKGKLDPEILATNRIVAQDAIYDRLKLERESEGSEQNIQTKRNLAEAGAEGTGRGQANVANQLVPTMTMPDGTIVVVQPGVGVTPAPQPPQQTIQPPLNRKGQPYNTTVPGRPEPVAPHDRTATAPPGGGLQTVPPISATTGTTQPTPQPQIQMRTREQIERENKATEARLLEKEQPLPPEAARNVGGFQTQLGIAQTLSQTVNPKWLGVEANRTAPIREKTARDSPGWEAMGLEGMSADEGAFRASHFTIGAEIRKAITGMGGSDREAANLDRMYPSLDAGSLELYQGQMQAYLSYANTLMQHYVENMVQGKGDVLKKVQEQGEQLKKGASEFAVAGWMFKNGRAPTAEQLQDGNYLKENLTPEGKHVLEAYRTRLGSGKIQLVLPQ